MLGDTLTVTLGGSGGTARVCSKILEGNNSSEYLHRNSTDEVRVRVRHTKESPKDGELYPIERHNVEFTQTVFATPTTTEKFRQCYLVIRNRADDTAASVTDLGEAIAFWLSTANLDKLIVWEV